MDLSILCGPRNDPAVRRYTGYILYCMAIYVMMVVLISWIVPISGAPDVVRIPAALTPVPPIVVALWAMGRTTELQTDEFKRMVQARGMLIATGFLLAVATGWGFLEEYADVAPFPAIIAFPIWCAAWPVGTLVAARRYR